MNKAEVLENIGNALDAHGFWKTKLNHAVESGQLPKSAADIACHDQCGLGIWLKKLSNDPQMADNRKLVDVIHAHAAFHKEAGHIAKLVEQNDKDRANQELQRPAYTMAADTLRHALILLRRQAEA